MKLAIVKQNNSFCSQLQQYIIKYCSNIEICIIDSCYDHKNFDYILCPLTLQNTFSDDHIIYLSNFTNIFNRTLNQYQKGSSFINNLLSIINQKASTKYFELACSSIDNFSVQQLQINLLPNLLPFLICENKCIYFIDDTVNIQQFYKENSITEKEIVDFMLQIIQVRKSVENYLLFSENVDLNEEHIFIHPTTKQLYFAYMPSLTKELNKLEDILSFFLYDCHIECDEYRLYTLFKYTKSISDELELEQVLQMLNDKLTINQSNAKSNEQMPKGRKPVALKNINQRASDVSSHSKKSNVLLDTTLLISDEKNSCVKLVYLKTNEFCILEHCLKFTIGTEQDNNFVVKSKVVSKHHAIIKYDKGDYLLQDNQSTNGTYLNNKQLKSHQYYPLKNGDIIIVANERFQFLIMNEL